MRATDYTGTIDFAFQRRRVYRKVAHNTQAARAPVYRGDASRREQISLIGPIPDPGGPGLPGNLDAARPSLARSCPPGPWTSGAILLRRRRRCQGGDRP